MKTVVVGNVTMHIEEGLLHLPDSDEIVVPPWITPQKFSLYLNFLGSGTFPFNNTTALLDILKLGIHFQNQGSVNTVGKNLLKPTITPTNAAEVLREVYPFMRSHAVIEELVAQCAFVSESVAAHYFLAECTRQIDMQALHNTYEGRFVDLVMNEDGTAIDVTLKGKFGAIWLSTPQCRIHIVRESMQIPIAAHPVYCAENTLIPVMLPKVDCESLAEVPEQINQEMLNIILDATNPSEDVRHAVLDEWMKANRLLNEGSLASKNENTDNAGEPKNHLDKYFKYFAGNKNGLSVARTRVQALTSKLKVSRRR